VKKIFSNEAFDVVKAKDFRLYLSYRFMMTTATLMQSVVVGWHIYSITHDVFMLGLIGLIEVIPQVSISLFAGHFIDIYDRKKIISRTTLLLLIGSAVLIAYSIPSFRCPEQFGVYPMFFTIFLTGFVRGILMPAHTAFLGQMVDREQLPRAATWNSTTWQVAAVTGPAIGGIIYGFSGVMIAYSFVFIFYLTSLILILSIKKTGAPIISGNVAEEGIFTRIGQGIHFVFKNQILLGAFSLDMFAVLFGGAVALLPVFASDILHAGPEGLGVLRACPAVGAILMSIYLTFNPPVGSTGKYLFLSVAGFGLCMIGFALSTSFILSAALLFFSGIFDNVSVVIRGTILQLYTPNEMKGRVSAVNSIFIGSSNELGAFESGTAARLMGLVPSVLFGGFMTLIVVGFASKKAPLLRRLSFQKSLQ
jgi:MFS family permease